MVSNTPVLAETPSRDWRKAAGFYARFEITQQMFRHGTPDSRATPEFETGERKPVPAPLRNVEFARGLTTGV
jgi:hypothetical protein